MSKKLKWPKASVIYDVPLYGGTLHLFKSHKKFEAAYRFLGHEYDASGCAGSTAYLTNEKGSALYIIGVYDKRLDTLVHEIGHATMMIMERVGVDAYASGGEPLCYLLGDMYEKLAKGFK